MTWRRWFIRMAIVLVAAVMVVIAWMALEFSAPPIERSALTLGYTYSVTYAEYLGLDPVAAFDAITVELRPAFVRLPVYWQRVESKQGEFDFAELDRLMDIASRYDTQVILAIGRKVPRWPECFLPDWTASLSQDELRGAQLNMMRATVERYRDRPSLTRWQVENEPFFVFFGECPRLDPYLLDDEYALVRSLDTDTPIQTAVSGEQSLWLYAARHADIVGASVYRRVQTAFGQQTIRIPPWTYRAKAQLVAGGRVAISELQAEPWFARSVHTYTVDEQLALFNAATLEENIAYVQRIGVAEVALWGVEWWYYLDARGESSLRDAARMLFAETGS